MIQPFKIVNRLIILVISIFLFLSSSCVSRKKMVNLYATEVTSEPVESMNGTYSNDAKGLNFGKNETFWYQLQRIDVKEKFEKAKRAEVKLEVVSKHKINATLYVKGTPFDSKILKGKYQNGCFVLKRKFKPHGIPLIKFHYKEAVSMLSLHKGDMQVHTKTFKYGGWFVFFKGKTLTKVMNYSAK